MSIHTREHRLLFAGHVLTYPAEGLRRNSEIGRDHILGKALEELGIGMGKVIVSFLGRHAERRMDPLLGSYGRLSIHLFDGQVETLDPIPELMCMCSRNDKEVRILQHFDVVTGRRK